MNAFPEIVREAWNRRTEPCVLATVDTSGQPNAVYLGCAWTSGADTVVLVDNYFDKTRANILAGSKGSLLFITPERKSYQLKGTFDYVTSGPIFDHMKTWNPAKHPGHAAVVLKVERIFSGSEQLA